MAYITEDQMVAKLFLAGRNIHTDNSTELQISRDATKVFVFRLGSGIRRLGEGLTEEGCPTTTEQAGEIYRNFVKQNWKSFVAGVDVGHVSSATAAVFFALDFINKKVYQLGEYWHCNQTMKYKESAELASDIVAFFTL